MAHTRQSMARDWQLRGAGAVLLALAWLTVRHLLADGAGHAGHEPAIVYLLSIVAFACASAGAALLINGRHLFDAVAVSERWMSRTPRAIEDSQWVSDLRPSSIDGQESREPPAR